MATNSQKPVLFDYFEKAVNVLLSKYELTKGQSSNNLGKNRESFCHEFLDNVLPSKLNVKSGEILDSLGNRTGQQDIIILRDDAPTLDIGGANTYLAEGVFCVIEIKSNLTREKLHEAGKSFMNVKNLTINTGASMSTGVTIDRPLRIVFAYEGATWETLLDEIKKENWTDLFDLICILDRGTLIKSGRGLLNWEGDHEFSKVDSKASSLGFLYYYLVSFGTSFIGRSISLNPYFQPINGWDNSQPVQSL